MSQVCNNLKRNLTKSFLFSTCLVSFLMILCKPKRMINTSRLDCLSHPNKYIFQSTLVPIIVINIVLGFLFWPDLLTAIIILKMSGTSENRSIELLPFGPLLQVTQVQLWAKGKKDGCSCVHFEPSHWLHESSISKKNCHHF